MRGFPGIPGAGELSFERRQVRAFEQCRHPAVVPFLDVGTAGGTHYLVWPLVDGVTLEKLVEDEARSLSTNVGLEMLRRA